MLSRDDDTEQRGSRCLETLREEGAGSARAPRLIGARVRAIVYP